MKNIIFALTLLSAASSASAAQAETVLPSTTWGTIPGENSATGSATINGTVGRSGNGSIELRGDRTRLTNGNYFDRTPSGLYMANTVQSLTFDWRIASGSTNPYNADYTPALRLHVFDPGTNTRSELIWEGAYNNIYGNANLDTWYTTGANDNFYQFVTGSGVTFNNGMQVNKSLSDWLSGYNSSALVKAISVGVGSGASGGYHAFADNVTVGFRNGDQTTYNFEASATSAVPEPASWAMMIGGFGVAGGTLRRRKKVTTKVAFA